ncbi:MAG: SET domain-containing protein, partial [Flavobacteriales bacterium]
MSSRKERPLKVTRRKSRIHGSGVFAIAPIRKGERIIEYTGPLITHQEADERYYGDIDTGHTFLFTLNKHWVIDANKDRGIAKWINTSCEPNAVAYVHSERKKRPDPKKDRVIIEALRAIKPGEEITYDYGLDFE